MMCRKFFLAVVLVAATVGLSAHDFWLAAGSWVAAPGSRVTISANVGDRFPVPTSYTAPERVESMRLVGPSGELPIEPTFRRVGNSLATDVQLPATAGTYMAVMLIKPRFIAIKPPAFMKYLTHEGLERIVTDRRSRGEGDREGRERYSRYAKVLIRAGDGAYEHVTQALGLSAELIPTSDPTTLRVGESLTLRLLSKGEAVSGALIGGIYAASKGAPDEWPLKARTNARGEATFRLDDPGPWLFRSVHMARRANETGPEAVDWESYWASLTFTLKGSDGSFFGSEARPLCNAQQKPDSVTEEGTSECR